jgi:lysophospholipase L1-like esterase
MHRHPWFEMMMTLEVPSVTFRNMGWSGDTVHGDARAVFGGRADGYQRLIKDSEIAAPNVAILCYGENEAQLNETERAEFLRGYKKLIEDLKAKGSRIVLVIPRSREDAGPQFPNPAYYNSNLSQVAEGIRSLARETQSNLIDLEKFAKEQRFTEEGVAWNDAGYRASAQEMMRQLGFTNLELNKLAASKPDAMEELRSKVESKNEWFFHRYRPQNETYLFLFRKHEQGNNAVEVDQMEQFVREGESKITQWMKDQNVGPKTK